MIMGRIIITFPVLLRNLKIAYFTQHHVDQLVLNVSALELIQSRYPGHNAYST